MAEKKICTKERLHDISNNNFAQIFSTWQTNGSVFREVRSDGAAIS